MKDINLTYEFFDGYQEILISRKVAEVIKKNVPDAEFYPVFKDTTYIKKILIKIQQFDKI